MIIKLLSLADVCQAMFFLSSLSQGETPKIYLSKKYSLLPTQCGCNLLNIFIKIFTTSVAASSIADKALNKGILLSMLLQ
jgi:hypothetical protein